MSCSVNPLRVSPIVALVTRPATSMSWQIKLVHKEHLGWLKLLAMDGVYLKPIHIGSPIDGYGLGYVLNTSCFYMLVIDKKKRIFCSTYLVIFIMEAYIFKLWYIVIASYLDMLYHLDVLMVLAVIQRVIICVNLHVWSYFRQHCYYVRPIIRVHWHICLPVCHFHYFNVKCWTWIKRPISWG